MISHAHEPHACPLCGCDRSSTVQELTGRQLRALWKELGHEFAPEAWGQIDEHYVIVLHRCNVCSFEFFDPALAGGEAFYQHLDNPDYYSPYRPEFARTLEFARNKGLRRILDVGCGRGGFLDLAKQAGCETHGLELNSAAADTARSKGHKMFTRFLGDLDLVQTSGGFDLITLFQVLEHVPAPVSIMRQASALLNPGGHISVAVPSSEGIYRIVPLEPAQWPPHHVSRWRLNDFKTLASSASLELVESGGDVLFGTDIEQMWNLHDRLAAVLGNQPRWGGKRLAAVASFLYRKTGMKFLFPHYGKSIFGCFRIH